MPEILLHYIWQQHLWAGIAQQTTDGVPIEILSVGEHNRDAGPDFSHAHLRIGEQEWVGNIEIHVRASDWRRHHHHTNPAYDNVILHVVCDNDELAYNTRGERITQCVLRYPQKQDYLTQLIANAQEMDSARFTIPCSQQLISMPEILTKGWRDALLQQRWQCKKEAIQRLLEITRKNWVQAFYITLAHNFGFHTNSQPFELLALQTPISFIQKHRNSLFQVTAILLGQSGLLTEATANTEEKQALWREYGFLQKKFSLTPIDVMMWKRARMRPQNAPETRIRQFAQLICQAEFLFSQMMEARSVEELRELILTPRGQYETPSHLILPPKIGKASVDILLINTLLPYRYVYSLAQQNNANAEKALALMADIPAENNTIIRQWRSLGQVVETAADSQALIHLYQHYCQHERCISCEVGTLVFAERGL